MKTWRKYRTYKRVQNLWNEYKEVAQNDLSRHDVKLVTSKLGAFLDYFQQSYVDFKAAGHEVSLESFYGDCSEVLVSLLDLVDMWVPGSHTQTYYGLMMPEYRAERSHGLPCTHTHVISIFYSHTHTFFPYIHRIIFYKYRRIYV